MGAYLTVVKTIITIDKVKQKAGIKLKP